MVRSLTRLLTCDLIAAPVLIAAQQQSAREALVPTRVVSLFNLVNNGFNATADRGRIAIQAEGAEVEFRKVEIGPLR